MSIEFQFKRDLVKSFRFGDLSELLWGLQDMWRHTTHTWLNYGRRRATRGSGGGPWTRYGRTCGPSRSCRASAA
jgi:hypothetical protein